MLIMYCLSVFPFSYFVENLLEDVSFEADGIDTKEVVIDADYVVKKFGVDKKTKDLKKYIL